MRLEPATVRILPSAAAAVTGVIFVASHAAGDNAASSDVRLANDHVLTQIVIDEFIDFLMGINHIVAFGRPSEAAFSSKLHHGEGGSFVG